MRVGLHRLVAAAVLAFGVLFGAAQAQAAPTAPEPAATVQLIQYYGGPGYRRGPPPGYYGRGYRPPPPRYYGRGPGYYGRGPGYGRGPYGRPYGGRYYR